MRMSLQSNLRDVERDLSDVGRRQLPFAASVALNNTAGDVHKNETRRLSKVFDRPTPFTRKAYAIRRSTKRRLEARVFVKPIQARYLKKQEEGGTRQAPRRAIVVPQKVRVNKYGNLPKGAVKRNLANPKVFSGKPNGSARGAGIYKRQGKKLVKLMSYIPRARYEARLSFRRSAAKTAGHRFPVHLERALIKAFATRRR